MPNFEPKFANLVQIYTASLQQHGDRPLFGTKSGGRWQWMSYREFGQKVDALRGGLVQLGIGKGDRVAIIANNRPEWAIAAYASYGLGAAFVPMYENQLDKDWKFILNDCEAKVVFAANESIAARVVGFQGDLASLDHVISMAGDGEGRSFDELLELGAGEPAELAEIDSGDTAGFIYTSGTTGNPKGVILSHGNLANNVSAIHAVFPMTSDDRSLSFLPWAHSFGQTCELHGLFSMGASMGIAEAVDKIIPNLAEVQPTLLFSVPRIFNRIYDGLHKKMDEQGGLKKKLFEAAIANAALRKRLAEQKRSSGLADLKHGVFDKLVFSKVRDRFGGRLKYAFSGGAALSKDVAEFIDNLGIKVYEGYGLTETSPIATSNFPGSRKIGSVGKPIPGVHIVIDRSVTEDPKHGEIVIHGHNVMQGYHGLEEENRKVLLEDEDGVRGFRSGDMGYVDDKGFLFISGRIKEQYKLLNGKYVVPSPLEEKLKLSVYISNVMIHGMNQNYNVALVIPDFEMLDKWARDNGIDPTDREALCANEDARTLMKGELDKYSADFKQFEKAKRFLLGAEDFSPDNGMLTPTLKLKRRIVLQTWAERLEALYT